MKLLPQFDVYLAGPFFNDEQRTTMDATKAILLSNGIKVLDPRDLNGIIVDDPELRKEDRLQKIFNDNIAAMNNSFAILACIDDRDTGTAFELGYFYSMHRLSNVAPILTFSAKGYGSNVMLAQATHGHFSSLQDLEWDCGEYLIFSSIRERNTLAFFERMALLRRDKNAKAETTE